MEPSMHTHSSPVDHSLASFLGTDTGFVAAKLPPKTFLEPGTIDPASETIIDVSPATPILPRWNKAAANENEFQDHEREQPREDHAPRRNVWRPKLLDLPENGMGQDTVDGWSRIVDMQAIDASENDELNAVQIKRRESESLGHRFTTQLHTLLDHKTNPSTDMQSLPPASWSSSPFTYEIHAIGSPDPVTLRPVFQQPVFWLAVLALFFCCALVLDLESLFYKAVARWNRKGGSTCHCVRGGKRGGGGEKRMLVDEEATWEFADAM